MAVGVVRGVGIIAGLTKTGPLRVAVVIANAAFARNFVDTGALDALGERCDVRIVAARSVRERAAWLEGRSEFTGWFDTDPEIERRHYFLFNVLMWRHRNVAGGFRFRAARMLGVEGLHLVRAARGRGRRIEGLRRFARQVLRPGVLLMLLLGTGPITSPFTRVYARRRIPASPALRRTLQDVDPDVVLFPSSAYDPVGNDVSRLARELGVPSIFLIDNWDNLSSKSLFWTAPDHVGVWGPQSRLHAEQIQGFPPERVHEVGTPRFESYLRARDASPAAPFPGRYALFLGCALPFDEISALRLIDAELEGDRERYGDLRVVYRPHPSRQQRLTPEAFVESDFRHVVLDPQMRELLDVPDALPELDWYGPLLDNSEFVIAPLTTMLIESLLFNKAVVVLAYDDGVHYTSPSRALTSYAHFDGIEDIDQVVLCRDERDLPSLVRRVATNPPTTPRERTDEQLSYYLEFDAGGYGGRIADLVEKVGSEPRS